MTAFLTVTENGRKRPGYTVDSDLHGEMTLKDLLDWTKSALIVTADTVLKEEQAAGFDKNPVVIVDGAKNRAVASVHPLGQITFTSKQQFGWTILLEAYEGLLERSKVLTGAYKSSHYVAWNGKQVANDLGSLKQWIEGNPEFKEGDIIRIVDIQPYARRLEMLGVRAGKTQNRRVEKKSKGAPTGRFYKKPNGAYQLTYRQVLNKYKNNVAIRFEFITGFQIGVAGVFKTGRKGQAGRTYLYPSLKFTITLGTT